MQLEGTGEGVQCFKVYHSKEMNKYFLKDLCEGPGVFIKIEKSLEIRKGSIISFGEHHLVANYIVSREENPDCSISIQIINGEKMESQL